MSRYGFSTILEDGDSVYTTTGGVGGTATHYLGPYEMRGAEHWNLTWSRYDASSASDSSLLPGIGAASSLTVHLTSRPIKWLSKNANRIDPTLPHWFTPAGLVFSSIPALAATNEGSFVIARGQPWTAIMMQMTVLSDLSGLYLSLFSPSTGT